MTGRTDPYAGALRRLRGPLLVAAGFSAAVNLLMLTGPVYMLQVYDRVLSSGSVATLAGLFAIVVVLYAFLGLYEFLRARFLSRAALRLDALAGDAALRAALEPARGAAAPAGTRPLRDLETVRSVLSGPAMTGVFDLPWMPIFLAVVFLIHPLLGWLTLAGAGVVAAAALVNQALTRTPVAEAMGIEAEERALVESGRRNAEVLRALGMEGRLVTRWRRVHGAALARGQDAAERSDIFAAFSKSFRLLLQSALLTVGAWLALRQEISPGMIIAASIIAGRALAPVDQVIGQWRALARAAESHRRLRGAFDAAPAAPALALPDPAGRLEVSGLGVLVPGAAPGADGQRPRILERVAFALEPGDGLGVIGNSAAGKSTLARVLVGAWLPDAGEVRLDGATLGQWEPAALGRHIGYLPQSVELLPGTLAENIARFDPAARDGDIVAAARAAGVHEMILRLPEGYATRIGAGQPPLSGGQIQRVGLARALYGTPALVVLDEPNANLDSEGDDALTSAISGLRDRGATVVVMAHRPSAIAAVNKVLVLHRGMVARFGSKEDILHPAPPATPLPAAPRVLAGIGEAR